jgi:3-oxoacid CoA-transferase subunit A
MVLVTGDTHRDFTRVKNVCNIRHLSIEDTMIILGDASINLYGAEKDWELKTIRLAVLPVTLFCIHGNHENRPQNVPTYREIEWHGGIAYAEPEFPNLIFAKDGEIYDLAGKKCVVIGGAYSVDKYYRLEQNWSWWEDEQPSEAVKKRVEERLEAENLEGGCCVIAHLPYEIPAYRGIYAVARPEQSGQHHRAMA